MSQVVSTRIQDHFAPLTDPRRRKVTYPLINIVTIAVCAIVAGADDFVSIAAWGRQKREWLEQFLDLSNGIPSHDRFNAVLGALKPAEFERCLLSGITALHEITDGRVAAIDGKSCSNVRYYILSRKLSAKRFGNAVRSHWGIENRLHWQLDVTFQEDQCRVRKGHADANLSRLRRTALSLLKNNPTLKVGIKNKRLAAWNNDYLEEVLFGKSVMVQSPWVTGRARAGASRRSCRGERREAGCLCRAWSSRFR